MPQTFDAACDAIMAICQAQAWIKQAPDDPPGAATQFPFAALFPGHFTSQRNAGFLTNLHTVHLEIHWSFRDLPRNTADAKDHLGALLAALWADPTLGGTVATIQDSGIDGDFGPMMWGAVDTLGYVIRITFKQQPTL